MCNEEKQDYLDVAKYYASEKARHDLSGVMNYCYLCPNNKDGYCSVPQEDREKYHICAIVSKYSGLYEPEVSKILFEHRK